MFWRKDCLSALAQGLLMALNFRFSAASFFLSSLLVRLWLAP
jgi:hypothetical protein